MSNHFDCDGKEGVHTFHGGGAGQSQEERGGSGEDFQNSKRTKAQKERRGDPGVNQ
jgi:hypothetical protein